MIDVYPPEHTPHTWRDFFIHIATIVVGLVIAIGLEQGVEYFHHRNEVHEARRALAAEHQENIRRYHANIKSHLTDEAFLHNNLRIFQYLAAHPHAPANTLPGAIIWPIGITEPETAAWTTAQQTGVLELMPREEVASYAAEYYSLNQALQVYQQVIPLQQHVVSYLTATDDASTLTPAEITAEISALQQRLAAENFYGLTLYSLAQKDKDYGPTPGLWQIDPFFYMKQEFESGHSDATRIRRTQQDIDYALSELPKASSPANPH
ncbi:MAG: hypothetical protein WB439_13875 [Acidobacteriaceae bacterium]